MTQESVPGVPYRKDSFSIEIALRHPAYDPQWITEVLSAQPIQCWKSGDRIGNIVKRSTHWYGCLSSGSAPDEFAGALEEVVSLLTKNEAFFTEFRRGDGEAELVLNHAVEQMEGKVFELYLAPALLGPLAANGIGLRVQGWNRSPG